MKTLRFIAAYTIYGLFLIFALQVAFLYTIMPPVHRRIGRTLACATANVRAFCKAIKGDAHL